MGAKGAKRQFLVSWSPAGTNVVEGLWAQKTGGEVTSETTKAYDGGDDKPAILAAPATPGNITLTRPYEPERDSAMAAALKKRVGRLTGQLLIQPTDVDYNVVGTPETFPDALLVGVTTPDVEAGSADASMISLEFVESDFT